MTPVAPPRPLHDSTEFHRVPLSSAAFATGTGHTPRAPIRFGALLGQVGPFAVPGSAHRPYPTRRLSLRLEPRSRSRVTAKILGQPRALERRYDCQAEILHRSSLRAATPCLYNRRSAPTRTRRGCCNWLPSLRRGAPVPEGIVRVSARSPETLWEAVAMPQMI
jgi:hypothetical protein